MNRRFSFQVPFGVNTTHWVNVVVHSTRAAMRSCLTRHGHKNSSNTEAACWQARNPTKDHCVAEIHLAHGHIDVSAIAHEASHASYHRTMLVGIKPETNEFDEWLANGTGRVSMAIHNELVKRKVIQYER